MIGLAGGLAEKYNKPTCFFTKLRDDMSVMAMKLALDIANSSTASTANQVSDFIAIGFAFLSEFNSEKLPSNAVKIAEYHSDRIQKLYNIQFDNKRTWKTVPKYRNDIHRPNNRGRNKII